MNKRLFSTTAIKGAILNREPALVADTFVTANKWEVRHRAVFRVEDRFYEIEYVRGRDGALVDPFRGAAMVEGLEVEPFERMAVDYRPVGAGDVRVVCTEAAEFESGAH